MSYYLLNDFNILLTWHIKIFLHRWPQSIHNSGCTCSPVSQRKLPHLCLALCNLFLIHVNVFVVSPTNYLNFIYLIFLNINPECFKLEAINISRLSQRNSLSPWNWYNTHSGFYFTLQFFNLQNFDSGLPCFWLNAWILHILENHRITRFLKDIQLW